MHTHTCPTSDALCNTTSGHKLVYVRCSATWLHTATLHAHVAGAGGSAVPLSGAVLCILSTDSVCLSFMLLGIVHTNVPAACYCNTTSGRKVKQHAALGKEVAHNNIPQLVSAYV
eukprot:1159846-Pelagomonas_calceolata.AAC.15